MSDGGASATTAAALADSELRARRQDGRPLHSRLSEAALERASARERERSLIRGAPRTARVQTRGQGSRSRAAGGAAAGAAEPAATSERTEIKNYGPERGVELRRRLRPASGRDAFSGGRLRCPDTSVSPPLLAPFSALHPPHYCAFTDASPLPSRRSWLPPRPATSRRWAAAFAPWRCWSRCIH